MALCSPSFAEPRQNPIHPESGEALYLWLFLKRSLSVYEFITSDLQCFDMFAAVCSRPVHWQGRVALSTGE